MFGRKKPVKVEPVAGGDNEHLEPKPIDGALGGKSRVKASKSKMIWWSVIVLAVVLAIANKVMQHKAGNAAAAAPATQGALPMGVQQPVKAEKPRAQPTPAPVSTNGGLPAMPVQTVPVRQAHIPPALPVAGESMSHSASSRNSAQDVAELIARASNDTATVVETFPGPGGMTGVIYRDMNHDEGVAWADPEQGLVFIGTLIGSNGKDYNTTADFSLAASRHEVDSPVRATASTGTVSGLRALMSEGTGFVEGTAGPQITVYLDPNSYKGHELFVGLQKAVAQNRVRVRYVLVALKDKGSVKKAEEILSAPSPAKELSEDERLGRKRATGLWTGGITGIRGSLAMAQQVDANTALLAAAGYIADPVVVWCDKQGKAQVATNDGAVGDLSAILSNVGDCH